MSAFMPFIILGLVSGSVYGLAALGLVLTYRTSGIFNFAHGTIAAVGAYAFYQLRQVDHVPWSLALAISVLAVGPTCGLLLERMARTLATSSIVARVVATVGLLVGLQGLATIHFGGATRSFAPFLPTRSIAVGGVRVGIDQAIVIVIGVAGTAALTQLLRRTKLGLTMRGVVDNDGLIALTGTSPTSIRRWSWCIGCGVASLSGILIAPTIGLDAGILTLLVVQAFGAAAFGLFTSLPLAYVGGLVLGIGSALASKYVASVPMLNGLPSSLPFILLVIVLVVVPRRRLVDIAPDRPPAPRPVSRSDAGRRVGGLVAAAFLLAVPFLVGPKLIAFTLAMAYIVIFLSLVLLDRLSGQLSLAQLSFSAVGGTAFCHLAHGWGVPWLVAVLVGALVAAPVGALLAIPAIRLSGLYLALASLGFGLLMEGLFYGQKYMFGGTGSGIVAPRPAFAHGDRAYYYVVLAGAAGAAVIVVAIGRSPLGRLLRAMSDSPLALTTNGMNVTILKVAVFCISASLAGFGGALLGPVTGQLAPTSLNTFASLTLVVIIALQAPLGDISAALVAALLVAVVPSYLVRHPLALEWLPVIFGLSAVAVAMRMGRARVGERSGGGGARDDSRMGRGPFSGRLVDTYREPELTEASR